MYQDDWYTIMRTKQLATWAGTSVFDVINRMNSDERRERDIIRKLFEWMDIHKEAQDEYRKQAKVK